MNLPPSLAARLTALGHPTTHVGDRGLARALDEEIVEHARARGEVIVTNDLDYGRILAFSGASGPSVVTLRLRDTHPERLFARLQQVLPALEERLAAGCVATVEDSTVRVRVLPVTAGDE